MAAFRPLLALLLAIAAGLAVYVIAHRLARGRAPSAATVPAGFGGWLMVLAIGQWLVVALVLAGILIRLPLYQRVLETPDLGAGALGAIIGRFALFAFVAWAALLMSRRSRFYPRVLRLELLGLVVLPALGLWLVEEQGAYVTEPKLWLTIVVRFVATAVFAALWYVYSQHSLRMRNTFVR